MDKRQLENDLNILEQQLILVTRYPESFEKALGKKGVLKFIDRILDKMILKKRLLKELENKKDDDE